MDIYVARMKRNQARAASEREDLLGLILKARQATSDDPFDPVAVESSLSSACSCLQIAPQTQYVTATASLSVSFIELAGNKEFR